MQELTIMAAQDGGFVVLNYNSSPGELKLPLFAGDLEACLEYMGEKLRPRQESVS